MLAALPIPAPPVLLHESATDRLFARVVDENDYTAFRQLFVQFYTPLVRQAMRLVKVLEIAEEVVSDVFIRFWTNRAVISIRSSFKAYLYRAVRNQALDYLKSLAHTADTHDELPAQLAESQTVADSPESELLQLEFSERVEVVVASLPTQCQTVFRLSRDRGLKYREIADELSLSIKTVETHMSRAFKVLREALSDYR